MAAGKRSERNAAVPGPLPRLPKIVWVALGSIAAAIYGFLFLQLPIAAGIEVDGVAISRAGFVIGSLLYPEGVIDAWFDGGHLPAGFFDRLPIIIGTLLWLGLAAALGLPLVDRVLDRTPSWPVRMERFAMAALIGLALLSTATLLVGLAGGLRSRWPLVVAVCALAALVYGLAWLARGRERACHESGSSSTVPEWLRESRSRGLFDRACVVVTVALVCWSAVVTMLGAWVPASEFDVLEYHLQAPKEFFELGSVRFLPHNIYANMPLGTEMHTLAMMTLIGQPDPWLGGLVGKSITAAFSLLGAALLGGYLARLMGALCGWWAAGLWLATPGIAHVAMLGLIDGALATYVMAAAVCVTRATEVLRRRIEPASESDVTVLQPDRSCAHLWWGLAGIMAGAAAAAKYPGLIFAVAPVCAALAVSFGRVWFLSQSNNPNRTMLRHRDQLLASGLLTPSGLLALGLIATCVPWYAKNWVQAGNPVYPLAAGFFGGKTLTAAKVEQWKRAHRVPPSAPPEAGIAERLAGGVRVAMKDFARLVLTSPYVQPAMVCGLCIGVCIWLGRRNDLGGSFGPWLYWSLWIIGVWWLATHRIDRFWLPLTGLWAALSAIGLCWVRGRATPWLAHMIVIIGLVYGGLLNSSSLISDNRYFVSLAALRDDATTAEQVGRVPAEQAWINRHLSSSESRVLLVGEARVFEYRVPTLYSTCFDVNPGEVLLNGKTSAEQTAALRRSGITHILIHWREIERYRSPGNYGFSAWPQPADIQEMLDSGVVTRVAWPIRDGSAELLRVE